MARSRTPSGAGSPLLTLASIVVAIAALHVAKEILLPLALAIFLSFLLTPLAERLERWGLGRILSVISVVGVTFVVLGVLGWIVTSQLLNLNEQLPVWRQEIIRKIEDLRPDSPMLANVNEAIDEVTKKLNEDAKPATPPSEDAAEEAPVVATAPAVAPPAEQQDGSLWARLKREFDNPSNGTLSNSGEPVDVRVVGMPPSPLGQMRDWLGPLVAPLTTAGMAIVLVIFILLKREDQRNRLLQLFGASNLHASTEALTDVTDRVSNYLRMQFLINAGYGLAVGLGLAAIGVPSAITWGVLSFALRFLPYIGPWLSAIMPLAVSIADSSGWTAPLMVAALFAVLELLVNNVAEPMLYGRSTGVSGVGVIVAAIFWTWIWGPIGLVLAMPLTVCVVVMARYIPAINFLAVLLGDHSTMLPPERIYQRLLAGDSDEAEELVTPLLTDGSLAAAYDNAVIPALILAEEDRHAGRLHDGQVGIVQEAARDLVEDLGELDAKQAAAAPKPDGVESAGRRAVRVLCIPLRDQADDISAVMLSQLLQKENCEVERAAISALTSELVEAVESQRADIVVLSSVPPLPSRSSRLLCRRLRDRYPQLPIVIGYWGGDRDEAIRRRLADDQSDITTTLAAAVERVRAIAARPQLAEKAG
ncbi:AI-2E family transporter [Lacipirellula sp.]|uniref:AI-2E family transporter n=1 Tax=Lacipirellula sp. TaxID=2691419 RepID=UPI003D0F0944